MSENKQLLLKFIYSEKATKYMNFKYKQSIFFELLLNSQSAKTVHFCRLMIVKNNFVFPCKRANLKRFFSCKVILAHCRAALQYTTLLRPQTLFLVQKSQQKRGLLCFCFASKTVLPAIGCGICKYPLVLDFESNWVFNLK